jgi:UMF1 family MFS transporter
LVKTRLDNPKTIFSWCLYDWANSVFSLVITSTLFPVYYGLVAISAGGGQEIDFLGIKVVNSALFSFAVSFSFLVAGFLSPFLSALADLGGYRRRFMLGFCLVGALASGLLYFFIQGKIETGILLFVVATVGYSGSIVFYNSFLPEIASPAKLEVVSARGFALGYIGSVLLLVLILLPLFIPDFPVKGGLEFTMICRIGFVLTGIWWMGFGLISALGLPKSEKKKIGTLISLSKVVSRILFAVGEIKKIKGMAMFLLGFFFMNMGVQTVMYLAAIFGDAELHMGAEKLIATILILQLLAIAGSLVFARVSKKLRPTGTLMLACGLWSVICVLAYFVKTDKEFYAVAALVGLVMGGSQSLLRSTFSHFIPAGEIGKSALFGFYDLVEKLSIVLGTLTFGLINQWTGSMRISALTLVVFFVLGLMGFRLVRQDSKMV